MGFAKTAGDVINVARDLHPAFGPVDSPSAVCRRFISRAQRTLMGKVWDKQPDYFGPNHAEYATAILAIPSVQATFDAGLQIVGTADLLGVREVFAQQASDATQSGQDRVEVLGRSARFAVNTRFPWAWVEGRFVFPGGIPADWVAYASLLVNYVKLPVDFPNDATKLALDDDSSVVLEWQLGEFLANRISGLPGRVKVDVGYFATKAGEAEVGFIERVTGGTKARTIKVQEVW